VGLGISEITNSLDNKNLDVYTKECLASTAEILRPKKKIKMDDLSTITLGYIKDETPGKKGD